MSVISVKDVEKKFKIYFDKGQSFKERILFKNRSRYEDRMVLRGISFDVKKGESIGLIGENGCGKSTLLKLMTRIMYPDNGYIEMKGRVSSLIELGAGFHPDMSGKENIYTNASIFGLTRKEINKRLNDIIKFSELEEYIDNPVRTYSSGMYMRLAFSVAINVDADILLIDEILAVGDAAFQAKCFNKLREIKARGTTIVIVSHSLGQIEQICDRSIWIDDGKIKLEGKPRDIHPYYLEFMGKKQYKEIEESRDIIIEEKLNQTASPEETMMGIDNAFDDIDNKRWGNGDARITKVRICNASGEEETVFKTGEDMKIIIEYKTKVKLDDVVAGIGVFRNDGVNCYGSNTRIDKMEQIKLKSNGKIICYISEMDLMPGEYKLDLALHTADGFDYDYYKDAKSFVVYSDIQDVGIVRLNHKWEIL